MAHITRLVAPDSRICKYCSGMGWVYVYDPRVPTLEHRLVKCPYYLQHMAGIMKDGSNEVLVSADKYNSNASRF